MDYMQKINDLRQQRAAVMDRANAALEAGNLAELETANGEMEQINNQIAQIERLAGLSANAAQNAQQGAGTKNSGEGVHVFDSLGEQLRAVYNAYHGERDNRLNVLNEALGGNVSIGADGGYAVQQDFAGSVLESAIAGSEILSRVDTYTVSAASNSARWLQIDETDVSTTAYGGVQTYWASEASTVAASKPALREMKLDLEKIMGIGYVTAELMEDASFMTGLYERAFETASRRLLEEGIINGDGSSKALGILKSGALVEVAKESGQTAGTVTTQNILDMWQRADSRYRSNMIWLAHPDLESQFPTLKLNNDNVWLPEGGLRGAMNQTILGRPVVYSDQCPAQGSKGDLMLLDMNQYVLLRKGAARRDWSMHVAFLTDQQCFRFVLRCNGAPKVDKPLKIKNSSKTRSPFVALGARA